MRIRMRPAPKPVDAEKYKSLRKAKFSKLDEDFDYGSDPEPPAPPAPSDPPAPPAPTKSQVSHRVTPTNTKTPTTPPNAQD